MTQEIESTGEGMPTLAAQFTRKFVERIVTMVGKIRKQGWTEEKIWAQMTKDLAAYPSHTVQRLYDMSLARKVADDVVASNVASEKQPKADTREVTVKAAVPGLESGGLAQYKGACWVVGAVQGKTYILKKLA